MSCLKSNDTKNEGEYTVYINTYYKGHKSRDRAEMTAKQVESKVMAKSRQEGGGGTHGWSRVQEQRSSTTLCRRRGHNDPLMQHIPYVDHCPAGGPTRLCPLWRLVIFHAIELQTNCLFHEYTPF